MVGPVVGVESVGVVRGNGNLFHSGIRVGVIHIFSP